MSKRRRRKSEEGPVSREKCLMIAASLSSVTKVATNLDTLVSLACQIWLDTAWLDDVCYCIMSSLRRSDSCQPLLERLFVGVLLLTLLLVSHEVHAS